MSAWTHSICERCWLDREGDREPVRIVRPDGAPVVDTCCVCVIEHESGIYFKAPPELMTCRGDHGEDYDDAGAPHHEPEE